MTFKIIKRLGAKTKRKFNEVYLIEIFETKELAVLKKVLKTDSNLHIQELIRKEAQFEFQNINLPKTLFFEETDVEISLIKKFFEGESLDVYWKNISKKDKITFLSLFLQQLTPIFQELRLKNIVHGDIKPANFILKGQGLDFEVKLIDFGLSFYPDDYKNGINKRKIVFSLGFSAPELILNKLNLANQATDIFALGICFYYLFEGKLPLSHPNPAIMTNLQLVHPILKPSSISADFFQIIEKMCKKESFSKPANLLSQEEVDSILKKGILKRYQNLDEIYVDFKKIQSKQGKSVLKRLVEVFSIPKIDIKK